MNQYGAVIVAAGMSKRMNQFKQLMEVGGRSFSLRSRASNFTMDDIREAIELEKPQIVVIDSIQTMFNEAVSSAPGSVSQVRESTSMLMQIAKGSGITIFIVGHVTKEGIVAGPRVLEHMVDTVLYFEGDRNASYRILRAVKNRFGSTNEIGVFEMTGNGLHEVPNPSEYMLEGRPENASGSVVACSMEGTRPVLIEIQALVCQSNLAYPRRTTDGADLNRVNLLLAVLEKRIGLRIGACDVYVNIAGGMRLREPAVDLGIIMAMISSYKDIVVSDRTIVFGEVGLSGEVRSVSMAKQRVMEAQKLGFDTVILPSVSFNEINISTTSSARLSRFFCNFVLRSTMLFILIRCPDTIQLPCFPPYIWSNFAISFFFNSSTIFK